MGDGCSWYAANDPGCTYYSTHYGQLTACPEACNNCPGALVSERPATFMHPEKQQVRLCHAGMCSPGLAGWPA